MRQFKICLLGAPEVGKTSLVQRFVHGRFAENYHSTIGVKIDKRSLTIADESIQLIVWDVQGEERYGKVLPSYLRGMAGYFMVIDTTRPETVTVASRLRSRIADDIAPVPFILLLNKSDLPAVYSPELESLADGALAVIETSARSGERVEDAFLTLGEGILEGRRRQDAA